MASIRLYFPIFTANQLFSPIISEYKRTKNRLQTLFSNILPQLKRKGFVPSDKLPVGITINFIINKDNFDTPSLLLLAYKIVQAIRSADIIQDTNNLCLSKISFSYTKRPSEEGCEISFFKD